MAVTGVFAGAAAAVSVFAAVLSAAAVKGLVAVGMVGVAAVVGFVAVTTSELKGAVPNNRSTRSSVQEYEYKYEDCIVEASSAERRRRQNERMISI